MGEAWTAGVCFPFAFVSLLWPDISTRFLYALYIAVDANFKLKGKERHLKDVELMPGWGAYVSEADYQTHVATYVDQPEVSELCSHTAPSTQQ
jgi:hypothetical protein